MTVWKYLKDDKINSYHMNQGWWNHFLGKIYERIGRRIIRDLKDQFIELFDESEILSSEFILTKRQYRKKKINFGKHKINTPDYVYLLHCKTDEGYEKRAVVFEIKSGISPINETHVTFWKDLLSNPSKYIDKCVKIHFFVLWIHGFDITSHNLFYSLKEVEADKIPPPDNNVSHNISNADKEGEP